MRTYRTCLVGLVWFLMQTALRGQDIQAPLILARYPAANSVVQSLNAIEVIFDEPVAGVDAADLLINNIPATDLRFGVPGQFVFEFASPASTGQVTVAFAPNHGITDLADPPNAFAGATWSLVLDPNSLPATFLITEFMASNNKTLNDENGDASDWIELFNPRGTAGNLEGWFLTDDASRLTKWRFPNRSLEAGAYMVVFASGKNRTNQTGNLHTSFQLSAEGEYLALVDPNTNIVSAFSPVYPPQNTDVSYGRDRGNPNLVGFFSTPTPRAPNASGGPGFVAEVQFSRDSGTFSTNRPFALSLSVATPGASIYYAFGTNQPGSNANSFLYTGPIQVTNTLAVRARAIAAGLLPSPITTKSYLGLSTETNVVNFNSDLPIMILHNYNQGVVPNMATEERFVFVQTFENPCGRTSMTNPPTLAVRGMFHARGSSTITSSANKAAFFLEVRDEFDDDREVPLLGLPAESDWILYAPNNFEPALFHNPLAHALARDLGEYASRTRFFEVYLKDDTNAAGPGPITSADYQGIYVLEEKIKRDNNRVDIAELQPEHVTEPEVTGGYMFSIDRLAPGESALNAGGGSLNWIEPSYATIINPARAPQRAWITSYLNSFNSGLIGTNYTNIASTNFYGNYIDVDSWVTRHIHEVVTFNVDALRLSGYLFKDRGKKIQYGPAWDYDRTQGSTDGRDFAPRTFRSTVPDLGTDFFNFSPWWGRLFSAPDFWQAWIDKYQEIRRPGHAFHFDNIAAHINRLANEVREAQPRERARWTASTPRSGLVTSAGFAYNFGPVSTYQNEVDFKFVWYSNRLDFIDTNLLAPPSLSSPGGLVASGAAITLNPGPKPGSALLYTLDGTDPRLPGGRISPAAFSNVISVTLRFETNLHVVARSYNPAHRNLTGANNPPISSPWSGPVDGIFYSNLPPLRITELMYHPPDAPAGSTNSPDDFEYIEFTNIGNQPLNLSRFRVRGGVDFNFETGSLASGASGVLVRNAAAFVSRYGADPQILGVYTNDNLSNSGETLRLLGPLGEPILDFSYDDDWYPATDGAGFSLVIVNPNAPVSTWGEKESWRPSGILNGSPGSTDAAITFPAIVINEISPHTDPPNFDAIELANLTGAPVDVGAGTSPMSSIRPRSSASPTARSFLATATSSFTPPTRPIPRRPSDAPLISPPPGETFSSSPATRPARISLATRKALITARKPTASPSAGMSSAQAPISFRRCPVPPSEPPTPGRWSVQSSSLRLATIHPMSGSLTARSIIASMNTSNCKILRPAPSRSSTRRTPPIPGGCAMGSSFNFPLGPPSRPEGSFSSCRSIPPTRSKPRSSGRATTLRNPSLSSDRIKANSTIPATASNSPAPTRPTLRRFPTFWWNASDTPTPCLGRPERTDSVRCSSACRFPATATIPPIGRPDAKRPERHSVAAPARASRSSPPISRSRKTRRPRSRSAFPARARSRSNGCSTAISSAIKSGPPSHFQTPNSSKPDIIPAWCSIRLALSSAAMPP